MGGGVQLEGRPVSLDSHARDPLVPQVVCVGAGFSGTLAVLRILDMTSDDVNIVILEKDLRNLNGGLAFGEAGAGWEHLLNVQAGRVSLFREEPDDFLLWANASATHKAGWPAEWQDFRFTPSSPVPRRVFAQYLKDRLAAVAARRPRSSVRTVRGEAVSVSPLPDGVVVSYVADGITHVLRADAAILATGHGGPVYRSAARYAPLRPARHRRSVLRARTAAASRDSAGSRRAHCRQWPDILRRHNDAAASRPSRTDNPGVTTRFRAQAVPADHLHDIPTLTERVGFLDISIDSANTFLSAFVRGLRTHPPQVQ